MAVSTVAKTTQDAASVTREHKLLSENPGNLCVKELNETVRLQSEKRQE